MQDKVDAAWMEVEKAARNQPVGVMPQVLAAAALPKSVYNFGVDFADITV